MEDEFLSGLFGYCCYAECEVNPDYESEKIILVCAITQDSDSTMSSSAVFFGILI